MSTFKVDSIAGEVPTDVINLPNKFKVGGNTIEQGYTASATQPSSPNEGDFWWDTANSKVFRYINGGFKDVGATGYSPTIAWGGSRALFAGGNVGSNTSSDTIDYVSIPTQGNATDFGDLLEVSREIGTGSNSNRAFFAGNNNSNRDKIEYVTVATTANSADFGNLTEQKMRVAAGVMGDGTYGLISGGWNTSAYSDVIDRVTIATTGNAIDHGDLVAGTDDFAGLSDATHAVTGGRGGNGSRLDTIDYVTIATAANAIDFGDISANVDGICGASDATRGLFMGGLSNASFIDYITIATPGNSTNFADFVAGGNENSDGYTLSGCASSNGVRVVYGAARWKNSVGSTVHNNTIQFLVVQTIANATDFGDLTLARFDCGGASGSAV